MVNALARRLTVGTSLLALAAASTPSASREALGKIRSTATAGAVGNGWGTGLACIGCAIGGATIAAGGPAAILVAASTPGSSLVLLSCLAACSDALK
jgi:hypothetical protein